MHTSGLLAEIQRLLFVGWTNSLCPGNMHLLVHHRSRVNCEVVCSEHRRWYGNDGAAVRKKWGM